MRFNTGASSDGCTKCAMRRSNNNLVDDSDCTIVTQTLFGIIRKKQSSRFLLGIISHSLVALVSFNCARLLLSSVSAPCEPPLVHSQSLRSIQPVIVADNMETTMGCKKTVRRILEPKVVIPDSLPGEFVNNTLYLQSIRLTTSFHRSVDDLHVDLFGFPGDLLRNEGDFKYRNCRNVSDQAKEKLLGRDEISNHVAFFCQLDSLTIHTHNNNNNNNNNQSSYRHSFHENMIQMFTVTTVSLDKTQDYLSPLIIRCNVTDILSRSQLLQRIDEHDDAALPNRIGSLLVNVWMRHRHAQVSKIATFSIPLDSGTYGSGSVDVRGGMARSYFQQPQIPIGLCLAVYGTKSLKYLSQFVQHHVNVGFRSIVIGIKGPPNSDEMETAQRLLKRYIDQGLVSLAHYDGPHDPEPAASKLQFYVPCLYHYKGFAKFVATWDIDEFWMPPDSLQVDGRHDRDHYRVYGAFKRGQEPGILPQSAIVNASSWSTFPQMVRDDPLWRGSRYAQSVSIEDTVNAIERYYEEHGCASSFCYHSFPSRSVLLRQDGANATRTSLIGQDFHLRRTGYSESWIKSIVNTKYAHSVGFHLGGSCFFDDTIDVSLSIDVFQNQFREQSNNVRSCYARLFGHNVYGSVSHFFELLISRSARQGGNTTVEDEYVSWFAPTVEQQLKRDNTGKEATS